MKLTIELAGKSYDAPAILQQRFGINKNTITNWVERGLLPTPIKIGRHHYFPRDLVDDFLSRGERHKTE